MLRCAKCGQSTEGAATDTCPQCGEPFARDLGPIQLPAPNAPFLPSTSALIKGTRKFVLTLVGEDQTLPRQHATLQLEEQERIIGRSEQADFVVRVPPVSRRHAAVWLEDGIPHIRDLGSRLGTFVNYNEIKEPTALRPGDRVSLGQEVHLQLVAADADEPADAERTDENRVDLPVAPRPGVERVEPGSPYMRLLSGLCSAMARAGSEEELFATVLEHLALAVRAERHTVVLGKHADDLRVVAEKQCAEGAPPMPPPSRGILRRVMYSLSDAPFVTCDAQGEKGIGGRSSIVLSKVRCVMCVGLTTGKSCMGMIYIDSRGADAGFSAADEQFLHVVGQLVVSRLSAMRTRAELDTLKSEIEARIADAGPVRVETS